MKNWKVGQRVKCDRPGKELPDCFVRSIDADSVVIFCPSKNTVICGRCSNLERLGWRLDDRQPELNIIDVDVDGNNDVDGDVDMSTEEMRLESAEAD
jgi:hypothetical protein